MKVDLKKLQDSRWSIEKAKKYMEALGAVKGCNYLPRFDHNSNEWPFTFKPTLYEEELGWAEKIGLNSIRFMVPAYAYQDNSDSLFEKLDRVIEIADSHDISVMLCLTCNRVKEENSQVELAPVHIRSAVHIQPFQLRGARRRQEKDLPAIKEFYQDTLRRYKNDRRIILWDLYNEAGPKERPLLEYLFSSAREVNPSQPLSACWQAHDISDVITFHTYASPMTQEFKDEIDKAEAYDRPMLCTEFMARPFNNKLDNVLPIFAFKHIGWYAWGLCSGSSQCRFPWRWPEGSPDPYVWFHNLLYPDGHPYIREEIDLIQEFKFLD